MGSPSDVMKTPVLQDMSALRRCNPPAFRLLLRDCGPPLAEEVCSVFDLIWWVSRSNRHDPLFCCKDTIFFWSIMTLRSWSWLPCYFLTLLCSSLQFSQLLIFYNFVCVSSLFAVLFVVMFRGWLLLRLFYGLGTAHAQLLLIPPK